jgi:Arc/MetJ-type ribon-helix-helix transcriptional regulator
MTTIKVAVSIPAPVLAQAKKEVAAGRAKSLSAFVSDAIDEKLHRDDLAAILDAMDAERGPPNRAAKAWAKSVLKRSS